MCSDVASCLQLWLSRVQDLLRGLQRPPHHPEGLRSHQELRRRRFVPEGVRRREDRSRQRRNHGIRQQPAWPQISKISQVHLVLSHLSPDIWRLTSRRCFLCRGVVTWSPSRCRTAWWPRCGRAAQNQRSNITPSSAPPRVKGQLHHYLCNVKACGRGLIDHITSVCRSDISRLEAELQKVTDALLDDFLEPDKNQLTRRFV